MNDDPGEVSVLYAQVKDNSGDTHDMLQKYCDALIENMIGAGKWLCLLVL